MKEAARTPFLQTTTHGKVHYLKENNDGHKGVWSSILLLLEGDIIRPTVL